MCRVAHVLQTVKCYMSAITTFPSCKGLFQGAGFPAEGLLRGEEPRPGQLDEKVCDGVGGQPQRSRKTLDVDGGG